MTREDLQALADFVPKFRDPTFKAGEWAGGEETEPRVFQMPYVVYAPEVSAFIEAAGQHSWIRRDFDWPAWVRSPEAASLFESPDLASATADDLACLMTACIRQDHFAEGALLEHFESGLILRICERAAALIDEVPPATPA
ncbi:DUF6508 domain-containing protein [Xanthobacter sp. 126]|uniref:DUF6508 domain-containing protein n=1 Tax=Xanthobacter sp. 126 TaxID=1131814 RepID=UPI00045E6A7D|nr:DUF6508 domain-containing protein [Xanthobacter sp. 126]